MASIYPRGEKLWCRLKGDKAPGKWSAAPTPYRVGDERKAREYADEAQQAIDERIGIRAKLTNARTVRAYVAAWLEARRESEHDWKQDRGRLTKHVLPVLGDMLLGEVRSAHIADLVRRLRFQSTPRLAPRTVHNIYSTLAAACRDAAIDGLIAVNPCILTELQLGPVVDKDPEWRSGALFTRDEAETLISHTKIPMDRRVAYGLGLLSGIRPGEAGALRWRHYDPTMEPLGKLLVAMSWNTKRSALKGTKTETTKSIPVHPTLAAMLAEWKLSGWAQMMGRAPTADDLIVPLPPQTVARWTVRSGEPFRGYDYSSRRWRELDLPMLGWRERSYYDMRSTFITLAIEDGADPAIIRDRVTHTKPKRSAFDGYDRGPHWIQTCAEIAKLQVLRRPLATPFATISKKPKRGATLNGSEGGYRTPDPAVNSRLLYH